jgi:hypothetical protein
MQQQLSASPRSIGFVVLIFLVGLWMGTTWEAWILRRLLTVFGKDGDSPTRRTAKAREIKYPSVASYGPSQE